MLFYTFSSVKLCLIDGLDGPKSLAPGVIIGWTFISTVLHYFEILSSAMVDLALFYLL